MYNNVCIIYIYIWRSTYFPLRLFLWYFIYSALRIQEFSGDNDALFDAEREEALARARELERQKQGQVGLNV